MAAAELCEAFPVRICLEAQQRGLQRAFFFGKPTLRFFRQYEAMERLRSFCGDLPSLRRSDLFTLQEQVSKQEIEYINHMFTSS